LKDLTASYVHEGRPKSMYKAKRFEDVDAFVTGGERGEEGKGWELLIGNLEFSAHTETGKVWMVAKTSNLTLEQRIDATVCGQCGGALDVANENQDGKRVVTGTRCKTCNRNNPPPELNPAWRRRCAAIRGQEWTARVYRLKHAVVERWRTEGEDAKKPEECTVNLADIQRRFEIATMTHDVE
jgi:ATP-dependent DNA ligase